MKQLAVNEPVQISNEEIDLTKTPDKWILNGIDATNQNAETNLVNAVKGLKVLSLASEAAAPAKLHALKVATNLNQYTYKFWQLEEDYYIQRNDKKTILQSLKLLTKCLLKRPLD